MIPRVFGCFLFANLLIMKTVLLLATIALYNVSHECIIIYLD